jgi:hypothetical protein
VRLQVLTPLSLLINLAVVTVCSTVVKPTLREVARTHNTSISPRPSIIAVYVAAIYLGQIGYCILLVFASKPETKRAVVKAVGMSLVLANMVMPLWAIAAVLEWFLVATVLQGLLLLFLLYSNIALLIYHPPTSQRPLDTALIHAPVRFFLALPLNILFPYCLFVTLGLYFRPTWPDTGPIHYSSWHVWSGFGVVISTNLLALLVIVIRQDIVWCIAATWLCISLWAETPKPAPILAAVITFTILHPLALFTTAIYTNFYAPRRHRHGPVALRSEDDALHRSTRTRIEEGRPASEVDPEQVWGR